MMASGQPTLKLALMATLGAIFHLAASPLHVSAAETRKASASCASPQQGIRLPAGFCATVFADNLGHARHLVVSPAGDVYVNTWSGDYYPDSPPPPEGFLVALRDTRGTGAADRVVRFGTTPGQSSGGGTGIGFYQGQLFAEVDDKIVRYQLKPGDLTPDGAPQVVVSGLPLGGDHPMHPFAIDQNGQMFIDVGSLSNSCQPQNRQPNVPGAKPCVELEQHGGLWKYDAIGTDQIFSPKERFVTGLRNGEGLSFDRAGRFFSTQHGRDQLLQNWPSLYPDAAHATELPAEELVEIRQGADYGWPSCYFDAFQGKLVLAPEYGGDGGHAVGECSTKQVPVAAYPAHWAPNDLKFYEKPQFPDLYQDGAFIAFHGSWNRSPFREAGYNIVFQPMKDGKPAGNYILFADGFAGASVEAGKAKFRPTGLAIGPDGALYVADDQKGRIWRITYHGPSHLRALAAAPSAAPVEASNIRADSSSPALPVPPGSSADKVVAGKLVFEGATCGGCHGSDATGTPLGPNLAKGRWIWSDGSLAALKQTITDGVPKPKEHRSPMPPMGGSELSPEELDNLAAYIWAVGHRARN